MANVSSILSYIKSLLVYQQEQILSNLEEHLVLGSQITQVTEEVKEFRFAKGKICPHCQNDYILRNGKYNCKERYICKTTEKNLHI